jgi:formylglycine-generating enzyme required for sulfatase activity/serine/threonine protein kinase
MADETGMRRPADPPGAGGQGNSTAETEYGNGARPDMPAQLGRYRIKRRLGGGGMGAVYLVENTELEREEALKVPHFDSGGDSSVRERFLREARAAARLHHPNLCPVYHADVIDGIYFLTMCYLEGKLLSAYTGRPHAPHEALKVVIKLAQVLDYAHGKGVIHRDLKPSNIMLCPGTGPTVMDFGLAKQIQQPDQKLTQTGATLGTPAYMPPEQVKGELNSIGPASDVYSLGVILFELLTGQLPFRGSTAAEVMGKILFAEAPLPSQLLSGLSPALDAVCGKAMAKVPEDRYPSMKDFAAVLQDVMKTLAAKGLAGTEGPVKAEKKGDDIFDLPTTAPEPPPIPKPLSRTIPDPPPATGPKRRQPQRKKRVGDPPPLAASRRGGSLVVWLCVTLLLAGAAVICAFLLRGEREKAKDVPLAGGRGNEDNGSNALGASFTNTTGMKLVRIPPGKFKMGSPNDEVGRDDNDEEQHDVEITYEFWLGIHEVTQKEFRKVMGYNPSYFSTNAKGRDDVNYDSTTPGGGSGSIPAGDDTEDYPVENVSWDEAKEFCEKLTANEKNKLGGRKYRLPTEAEWEYSCRGRAPFSYEVFDFGSSLSGKQANFDGNNPYGGADQVDPLNRTRKVGSYPANRFGLHDMHGNVWEWCLDRYDKDYYAKSPPQDPPGPLEEGSERLFRGGSWNDGGQFCRSAFRHQSTPAFRSNALGFRVALVPSAK